MTAGFDTLALPAPPVLAAMAAILLLGGLTKGLTGIGLPLVTVPLLALLVPVQAAVAILIAPLLGSNLYQMLAGGHLPGALARNWPLLLPLCIVMVLTAPLFVTMQPQLLEIIVAAMILLYLLGEALRLEPRLRPGQERWLGPVVGVGCGLLAGVSSFMGPPLIVYFMAQRLDRAVFVASISLVYFLASVILALSLARFGRLGVAELGLSLLGMLPFTLGLVAGQRVRARLDAARFRLAINLLLALTVAMLLL